MNPSSTRYVRFAIVAFFTGLFFPSPRLLGGANLVAIGSYSEMPLARAEGRISFSGKEVVYTFDDPNLDFGRVVVRSTEALSVVRRDLFVGYNGAGLAVDARGAGGSSSTRVTEVEFWLRIEGNILGGRKYEWEFEGGVPGEEIESVPAIIPMLWADGQPLGAEVTMTMPQPEDSDRIQRLVIPRGIVEVPSFERQTGAAWIVLKPGQFNQTFVVQRMSLREVEDSPEAISATRMPIPVRYVPIKDPLEDQIAEVMNRTPLVLKSQLRPNGAFADGAGEAVVAITAAAAEAIALLEPEAENIPNTCEWLSQQAPETNQAWGINTVAGRLLFMAQFCGTEKYGAVIRKDVDTLAEAQIADGGWPTGAAPPTTGGRGAVTQGPRADHFTTVNAMAALREARRAGAEVSDRVWKSAMGYWTEAQSYGGGYTDRLSRYGGVGQVTSTGYTALGAGALLLALDMASETGARRCGTYLASSQQLRAADGAFDWLRRNYSDEDHESGSFTTGINPYLKPQASILLSQISGVVDLDEDNVLRAAAAGLLQHYDRSSAMFGVRGQQGFATQPSLGLSALALANLAAAGAPTVCQRIIVGDDAKGWAKYSLDVAHLVQYMSQKRGKALNWRQTDIEHEVREIAEVPLTVLRVQGDFEWTPQQWNKLREYTLVGGTLLIDVAPEAADVREKLKSSLAEAFPEYKLAIVPADDPLLKAAGDATIADLQGISNGFRYFVLFPSESWACHWQLNQVKEHEASFAFMDGLLTYVTDGGDPRSSFALSPYEVGAASSKNMTAARMQVGSDVPAYPNLIDAISRLLQANYRLEVKEAKPEEADLLWVNVTGPGPISADASQKILSAIKGGKFVLADVISGNGDWAEEFEGELKKLNGKISIETLLRTDPVFTGAVPGTRGFNATRVHLRKALHTRFDKAGRCDLYTILWEGNPVGIFSGHDLASGIGYHYFPDCRGPAPDGARQIAMNIFLSAYGKKLGVTTAQR